MLLEAHAALASVGPLFRALRWMPLKVSHAVPAPQVSVDRI